MAYDLRQKRIMAWALARTGGNVAAAIRELQGTLECSEVAESTLRRFRDTDECGTMAKEALAAINEEAANAIRQNERARAKRELQGNLSDRVLLMEGKVWELSDILCDQFVQREADPAKQLALLRQVHAMVMDLKKLSGTGINEYWQADCMLRAINEILGSEYGPETASAVMKRAGARYQEYVKAHAEKAAQDLRAGQEVTNGEAQTSAAVSSVE